MMRPTRNGFLLLFITACAASDGNGYGEEYLKGVVDGVALGIDYDALQRARPKVFSNSGDIAEMGYGKGEEVGYWFWRPGELTTFGRDPTLGSVLGGASFRPPCRGCVVAAITRYLDDDPRETWDRVRAQWSSLGGVPTAERRAKVPMGTLDSVNVRVTLWKREGVSFVLVESDSAYGRGWFRRATVFDSRLPEHRFAPGASDET
jgi:hypothetical protein